MIKEFMTHIWGLSLFYNKKNRYTKRWKVGENGEWEFKNKKEATESLMSDKNFVLIDAHLCNGKHVKINVHKSIPKYASSQIEKPELKAHVVYDDTPLPFPDMALCFRMSDNKDEDFYREL